MGKRSAAEPPETGIERAQGLKQRRRERESVQRVSRFFFGRVLVLFFLCCTNTHKKKSASPNEGSVSGDAKALEVFFFFVVRGEREATNQNKKKIVT